MNNTLDKSFNLLKNKFKVFSFLLIASFFYFVSNSNAFSILDCNFISELKQGDKGFEVACLQRALNTDPDTVVAFFGPGSFQNETEYFGELTTTALKKLQNKLAKSYGVSATYFNLGVTDKNTRDALNSLVGFFKNPTLSPSITTVTPTQSKSVTSVNQKQSLDPLSSILPPKINSITPKSGKNGTLITISGSGFDLYNNKIIVSLDSREKYTSIPSVDGKTIQFKLDSDFMKKIQEKMKDFGADAKARVEDYLPKIIPIALYVTNNKGSSEPIFFNLETR